MTELSIRKHQGLAAMTHDELAGYAADGQPGSVARGAAEAEFLKRQTESQERAVVAAEEMAASTNITQGTCFGQ